MLLWAPLQLGGALLLDWWSWSASSTTSAQTSPYQAEPHCKVGYPGLNAGGSPPQPATPKPPWTSEAHCSVVAPQHRILCDMSRLGELRLVT